MSIEKRGRFIWYDLMTADPKAAQDFYSQLIGWGTQEWKEGDQPYTMWTNKDAPLGGVMDLPEDARKAGAPPHWLAYIAVTDVDATVRQAQELGANVLVPGTEIPKAGKFAVLQDPQGAVFAVYASSETPATEHSPKLGDFSWHELATTDYEGAYDFYSKLFGWNLTEAMDMGEAGTYQMYGKFDKTLGGMFNKPAEMPGPPFWLYYVTVPDVDSAAEQVKEMGGQVLNGPMEVPGGDKVAQCLDPQGAAFALHSTAPQGN